MSRIFVHINHLLAMGEKGRLGLDVTYETVNVKDGKVRPGIPIRDQSLVRHLIFPNVVDRR